MMINLAFKNAQMLDAKRLQLMLIALLVFLVTGCGEVDDDDGDLRNEVALPTDDTIPFDLYCIDIGIFDNTCVLDDPANPYARSIVTDDTKFDLWADAPSSTAKFYVWATALARAAGNPGENQFYVALSLHEMWASSNSELTRLQALRAYRSYLDNYFDSITIREEPPDSGNFFPRSLNLWTGQLLFDPVTSEFSLTRLFNPDPNVNKDDAAQEIGTWGYYWDLDIELFTKQP